MPEVEINAIRLDKTSPLVGKSIMDSQIRTRFGVNILAIVRDKKLTSNPDASEILKAGDILYIIGSHECCQQANRNLSGTQKSPA